MIKVYLHDFLVFKGEEEPARQYAAGLIMQIKDKHTFKGTPQSYVEMVAYAVLKGDMNEFVPEVNNSLWTVTLKEA